MTLYLQKLARRAMGQELPARARTDTPYPQPPPLSGTSGSASGIDAGPESYVRTVDSFSAGASKRPCAPEASAGRSASLEGRSGAGESGPQDRSASVSSRPQDQAKLRLSAGEDDIVAHQQVPAQEQPSTSSKRALRDGNFVLGNDRGGNGTGEIPELLSRIASDANDQDLSSGTGNISRLGTVRTLQAEQSGDFATEDSGVHHPFLPEPLLPPSQRAVDLTRPPASTNGSPLSRGGGSVEETTEVHVHIGRIEVTAVHEAAPVKPGKRKRQAPMSLDDYLARRHGRHS